MLLALRTRWRSFFYGFWFLPGITAAAFGGLAFVLLAVDRAAGTGGVDFLFSGTASAARTILSTIAASVITVAGLSLSITIVALQLVSAQFSPRSTRELLGDRLNQFAAGTFLGVFLYCLLVLRDVRDETESFVGFVPSLSVTAAIALGVFGLGMLLLFIHHMAQSIKLPHIASRIGRDTLAAIDALYPEPYGPPEGRPGDEAADGWEAELGRATPVYPNRPGYVQHVQLEELVERLDRPGSRIHVLVRPGDFVTPGTALVDLRPGLDPGEDGLASGVRAAITVDDERDVSHDVAFGLQQLKDIVLRAMSPSVNDPSSAITCIAYIGACLERLAGRSFPPDVRRFGDRDVIVAARRPSFPDHVDEALGQLPSYIRSDPKVVAQTLRALGLAAEAARRCGADDRLRAIADMAERVAIPALEETRDETDEALVRSALERLRTPLAGVG